MIYLLDRLNDAFQIVMYYTLVFIPMLLVWGLVWFILSLLVSPFWAAVATLILFLGRGR